jgi:hypothetical protein
VVQLKDPFLNTSFKLINLYVPYVDRLKFWEGLSGSGNLNATNIILGGDLNFSLSLQGVWVSSPHPDSQGIAFPIGLNRTI